MSQLNDCILSATGGPTVNDGLLAYYKLNGATSNTLLDAEREFLLARVGAGVVDGHTNDMWQTYLTFKGYTGTLTDMLNTFWCVNNGVP